MKIISVVGARPNFMKIAPFAHAIEKHSASLSSGLSLSLLPLPFQLSDFQIFFPISGSVSPTCNV